MAGPDRRRVSLRQVTTATPAGLDFRATGVADEGCADTMSTESPCSIAQGLSGLKRGIWIATRKHREFGTFLVGMLKVSEAVWSSAHLLTSPARRPNPSRGGTRTNARNLLSPTGTLASTSIS